MEPPTLSTEGVEDTSSLKLKINLTQKKVTVSPSPPTSSTGINQGLQGCKLTDSGISRAKRPWCKVSPLVEDDYPDMAVGKVDEGRYIIESIRKERTKKGKLEYFVKWVDWDECYNTWEPKEHLDRCSKVLDQYLKMKGQQSGLLKKRTSRLSMSTEHNHTRSSLDDSGLGQEMDPNEESLQHSGEDDEFPLDRIRIEVPKGKIPWRLLHVTVVDNDLVYLIEYKTEDSNSEVSEDGGDGDRVLDNNKIDLFLGKAFRHLYPQLVIDFYQSRIVAVEQHSEEELGRTAAQALANHYGRIAKVSSSTNVDIDDDSGEEVVDLEDEDDLLDKFGFPNNLDTSDSESSSNSDDDDED